MHLKKKTVDLYLDRSQYWLVEKLPLKGGYPPKHYPYISLIDNNWKQLCCAKFQDQGQEYQLTNPLSHHLAKLLESMLGGIVWHFTLLLGLFIHRKNTSETQEPMGDNQSIFSDCIKFTFLNEIFCWLS